MSKSFKLMVIIPAFDEEATIQQVISGLPKAIPNICKLDVLVVDDGSTDATAQLALQAGARVISHPRNLGVGKAIQSGLTEAIRNGVDIAVNIDADGQFDPADICRLVQPIVDEKAEFVPLLASLIQR